MGFAFDGLLGLHIIFALIWIASAFISLRALMTVSRIPSDTSARQRAIMVQRLVAAAGGLTVLIGIGFYYYINFYRTAYATSPAGLPLIDTGALLGIIVFVWQMAQAPRIRRALKSMTPQENAGASSSSANPQVNSGLPKTWMLLVPAFLLVIAFLLMIGGSSM